MDADAAAREAAEVVAEGITTIMVKIGVDRARRRGGRAVRAAIGSAGKIRVDANQAIAPGAKPCALAAMRNTTSPMPNSRSRVCMPWLV
jgi:L-alanine-DL-glutamate epimerase-like enolase superfamily enzyme